MLAWMCLVERLKELDLLILGEKNALDHAGKRCRRNR